MITTILDKRGRCRPEHVLFAFFYFMSDCLLTLRKMFNKDLFFFLFSLSFNTEVICVRSALAWRWDHWWVWVITVIIIISFATKAQFYIRHSLLFELVLFLLLERLKREVSIIGERCFYWLNYVCEPSYNFRKLQSYFPCCLAKMEITKFSFLSGVFQDIIDDNLSHTEPAIQVNFYRNQPLPNLLPLPQ